MKTVALRSAVLATSTSTTVTTVAGDVVIVGSVSDVTSPTMAAQQTTVGYRNSDNSAWSRAIRASDVAITIVRNGANSVAWLVSVFVRAAVLLEESLTWTPPTIVTAPVSGTVVADGSHIHFVLVAGSEYTLTAGDYAWKESSDGVTYGSALTTTGIYDVSVAGTLTITPQQAVLTSNNTTMSDGDQVKLGAKTYTFKTALTPTEGEVLINGSADAGLLNLIRAINHTGTPDTDYKCAVANAEFTADAAVTAHHIRVAAKAAGTYDTTTPIGATLSWTAATVTSKTGYYYKCTVTDHATTPGSTTTAAVVMTVT